MWDTRQFILILAMMLLLLFNLSLESDARSTRRNEKTLRSQDATGAGEGMLVPITGADNAAKPAVTTGTDTAAITGPGTASGEGLPATSTNTGADTSSAAKPAVTTASDTHTNTAAITGPGTASGEGLSATLTNTGADTSSAAKPAVTTTDTAAKAAATTASDTHTNTAATGTGTATTSSITLTSGDTSIPPAEEVSIYLPHCRFPPSSCSIVDTVALL